ncbi:hypothetical protein G7K_6813-t2 [Saitoella complicata NRRL Y-17804]|uniref:Uncharacterized protein n=1 Tax=Saitoella complicata (strain BCRC 22490 / CBS 7301 / JCM 7358 / NBRC 10748 / NRRL Y-17804) TaxID=698492 RepID=A0A0E9NSI9_SAICN|nr:hypothetical protein G7K_6813-t2 [Saitoella complicata NRRL Y-17804]
MKFFGGLLTGGLPGRRTPCTPAIHIHPRTPNLQIPIHPPVSSKPPPMSTSNPTPTLRAQLSTHLLHSGAYDRINSHLRLRLEECGWSSEMRALARGTTIQSTRTSQVRPTPIRNRTKRSGIRSRHDQDRDPRYAERGVGGGRGVALDDVTGRCMLCGRATIRYPWMFFYLRS